MQDAQDTRYQTAGYTELPYQSQKKAEKIGIPGSAAFEDTPALGLPRAACCPSAAAKSLLPARLCWHFLPQPPPHSRLCSHCHSALPTALHQCPSPAETTLTPLHQPVTCVWGCAFCVACAGQTNADFFCFLTLQDTKTK